jgi:hypothetical protein
MTFVGMGSIGTGRVLPSPEPDREEDDERADGRLKNLVEATSEEMGEDEGVVALRCCCGCPEWEVLELEGEEMLVVVVPPERTGVDEDE